MQDILIRNWQDSGQWQIAKMKLIGFLQQSTKFYSLRYIEINTQIETALLKQLLASLPNIECIEENYRLVRSLRKPTAKQQRLKEFRRLQERAYEHAIKHKVPKTRARLAAMNAFRVD